MGIQQGEGSFSAVFSKEVTRRGDQKLKDICYNKEEKDCDSGSRLSAYLSFELASSLSKSKIRDLWIFNITYSGMAIKKRFPNAHTSRIGTACT